MMRIKVGCSQSALLLSLLLAFSHVILEAHCTAFLESAARSSQAVAGTQGRRAKVLRGQRFQTRALLHTSGATNYHELIRNQQDCPHTRSREAFERIIQQLHIESELNTTSNRDRLAIVILMTDLHSKGRDRLTMLHANIRLLAKHFLPVTPSTIYIFTSSDAVATIQDHIQDLSAELGPWVHVLPVVESSWVTPEAGRDPSHWHGPWAVGYRLMGDWRLEFMPRFVKALGHRYVLQWDDDSYILGPMPFNIVERMDSGRHKLAAWLVHDEPAAVTWGLPELTKYFLMAYHVKPTTLFDHCSPRNLRGLYSATGNVDEDSNTSGKARLDPHDLGNPEDGGWDRKVLYGNCVVISLDFWFQPLVQRFVQLCRHSGGTFMYRWNEQSVIGMINHVFVQEDEVLMLEFDYAHRNPGPEEQLRAGGIRS